MRSEREVLAVWVDCQDGSHVAAVQSARLDVVRRLREMADAARADGDLETSNYHADMALAWTPPSALRCLSPEGMRWDRTTCGECATGDLVPVFSSVGQGPRPEKRGAFRVGAMPRSAQRKNRRRPMAPILLTGKLLRLV
jgi:hypothetical protein